MIQKTTISTRHLSDLWRLPVVQSAYKTTDGKTYVVYIHQGRRLCLTDGDSIIQDTATGEWGVVMSAKSMELNSRPPRHPIT